MSEEMAKRILDDETRALLLGDLPFNPSSTIPFTPKQFLKKGSDGAFLLSDEFMATFILKGMSKQDRVNSRKLVLKVQKGSLDNKDNEKLIELVRCNVVGWENVFDLGTKEEMVFKSDSEGGCDKDSFDRIPEAITGQIFFELARISGLLDTTMLSLES